MLVKFTLLCAGFGGFGGTAATSTTPAFGATGSTGFGAAGGFGTALGSSASLFGQSAATTTTSAFGFKAPATSTSFGLCNTGGLFGTQRMCGYALKLSHCTCNMQYEHLLRLKLSI